MAKRTNINGVQISLPDDGNLQTALQQVAPNAKQVLVSKNDGKSHLIPVSKINQENPDTIAAIQTNQNAIGLG